MKLTSCTMPDCANDVRARGLCTKHYKRWQRHGDAAHVTAPEEQEAPSLAWRKFGPEGHWSAALDESDQLAIIGAS